MTRELSVLVNACTAPLMHGGIPAYAREISAALARQPGTQVIFGSATPAPAGTVVSRAPSRAPAAMDAVPPPCEMERLGANVYLGTEYSAPVLSRVPRVVMVHDLAHRLMPKLYTRSNLIHVRMLFATLRRAERLLAPTAAVANDIVRYLDFPRQQVRVVPEAGRSGVVEAPGEAVERTLREMGVERPFILAVGTLNRHKRTVDLIRALGQLRTRGRRPALVVVGASTAELFKHYRREAATQSVETQLHLLGEIPDSDLNALYTAAVALAFPSILEGFGMPPLEGMACGTPVIAADITPLRETLGEAAMLVPPRNPAAIAKAVETLLASPSAREEWGGAGVHAGSAGTA